MAYLLLNFTVANASYCDVFAEGGGNITFATAPGDDQEYTVGVLPYKKYWLELRAATVELGPATEASVQTDEWGECD